MSISLLIAAAASAAACPADPIAVNAATYAAVESAETDGWSFARTADVAKGVYSDGSNGQDVAFVTALSNGCKVVVSDGSGRRRVERKIAKELRAKLALLTQKLDMEEYWKQGEEGQATLGFLHHVYPGMAVTNFVASKFYAAWDDASITDAFKPFRDLVSLRYGWAKASADPDQVTVEREMLYRGIEVTDGFVNDAIPDHFYNWVKP